MFHRRWLDHEEAARYLSLRPGALLRLVKQGRLPAPVGRGRQRRWPTAEIDAAMGALPSKAVLPLSDQTLMDEAEIVSASVSLRASESGIYFLIKGRKVVYVGQSRNVIVRLAQHVKDSKKVFDAWVWFPCPRGKLSRLETVYIKKFKPKLDLLAR
jgi:excisionase family DNA binding protein